MAKRGYRGPHPYNDTKVSPKNPSSDKYSSKLTTEYNKLNSNKKKYDYIRTHYFYPQGTLTISGTLDLAAASQITMSSTDGTVLSMKGVDGTSNTSTKLFQANSTAEAASNGIRDIINVNMAGKITASVSGDVVTCTQEEPGPDGNSAVTLNAENVDSKVTFNSVSAAQSGSGTLKFANG